MRGITVIAISCMHAANTVQVEFEGEPQRAWELQNFFGNQWPQYVERVDIHKPRYPYWSLDIVCRANCTQSDLQHIVVKVCFELRKLGFTLPQDLTHPPADTWVLTELSPAQVVELEAVSERVVTILHGLATGCPQEFQTALVRRDYDQASQLAARYVAQHQGRRAYDFAVAAITQWIENMDRIRTRTQ